MDIFPSRFPTSLSEARESSVPRRLPVEALFMRNIKHLMCFACAISLLVLAACSINVKKEKNGEDKQVDINTPVGGIHVSKGVNPDEVA